MAKHFQFRLRTLLIVVTAFCLVAGGLINQAAIVRDRNALLKRAPVWGADDDDSGVPLVRRFFGDSGIGLVQLEVSASDDELACYRAAFPEACVFRSPVFQLSYLLRSAKTLKQLARRPSAKP
jgi:hypothetical protein